MTVVNWFHVWAGPGANWREPVEEHLQALARSRFDGKLKVGIVGPIDTRIEALDLIHAQRPPAVVEHFETGWEQATLRCLRADAKRHPNDLTLYTHTKGASHNDQRQMQAWRRSMTYALLANLSTHAQTLSMIYQTVGCHWLDPLPSGGRGFGGNFWLARNDYLASLPPVRAKARHDAESWIASGDQPPVLLDLNPGYPGTVPWLHGIGWPR